MMVKVDELNEHIEKFGAVTNKLNEISNICEEFDKTAKQVAETCSKQSEMIASQEKSNTELKAWLDITLKNTESNLKDKIALQESKVSGLETKLNETGKTITETIESQGSKVSSLETKLNETGKTMTETIESQDRSIQQLTGTIRTLKTLVIITLICSVLAIGATILMKNI